MDEAPPRHISRQGFVPRSAINTQSPLLLCLLLLSLLCLPLLLLSAFVFVVILNEVKDPCISLLHFCFCTCRQVLKRRT
jgi:hypothetical protein